MGIIERLTFEAASAHPLLASEHVHRYTLAASLCGGERVLDLACGSGYGSVMLAGGAASVVGVDNDSAVVDMAAATAGREHPVQFVAADAVDYLRRDAAREFGVVVCFQGLEHMEDLDGVLDGLRLLARAGTKLVLSVPNSRMLEDEAEGEGPRTAFDYESALEAFRSLGEATLVFQFLAEGSLIRREDHGDSEPQLSDPLADHGEPEWANHFVGLVGFDDSALAGGPLARAQLAISPAHNRAVRSLQRANRELWYANARLAREKMGTYDTAAVAALLKVEQARADARRAEQRAHQAELRLDGAERQAQQEGQRAEELWVMVQELRAELTAELRRPGARARRLLRAVLGGGRG